MNAKKNMRKQKTGIARFEGMFKDKNVTAMGLLQKYGLRMKD